MTTSLFYHSLSNHHKVKVLRHILTLPLFFNFFFLDFKITFFLTFFGVFVLQHNLTNSLLFYHYLSNYHEVNVLRHIWPFLLFFDFYNQTSKLNFLQHILGSSPTFYSYVYYDVVDVLGHNLTTSLLFYHYLSNYYKINVLWYILILPPSFFFWSRLQD